MVAKKLPSPVFWQIRSNFSVCYFWSWHCQFTVPFVVIYVHIYTITFSCFTVSCHLSLLSFATTIQASLFLRQWAGEAKWWPRKYVTLFAGFKAIHNGHWSMHDFLHWRYPAIWLQHLKGTESNMVLCIASNDIVSFLSPCSITPAIYNPISQLGKSPSPSGTTTKPTQPFCESGRQLDTQQTAWNMIEV